MPNVYDDQMTKQEGAQQEGIHDNLGVHPERREAEIDSLNKALDAPSISDQERNPTGSNSDDDANDEEEEKLGNGFTDSDTDSVKKKKFLGRFNKRRSLAAIAAFGVVGFGGFWGFTILQGPLQLVHISQTLMKLDFSSDQDMGNSRTGRLIQYAKTRDAKEKRNLSTVGNKFANHYEKKLNAAGITPDYGGTRRIKAFQIDPNNPKGKAAMDKLRSQGFDIDSVVPDANGRLRIDIDSGGLGSTRQRRVAIAGMVDIVGLNNISSAVASRTLKIRGGVDFHPFKNVAKSIDEDLMAYLKKEREKRIRNGVDATTGDTVQAGQGSAEDGTATDPSEADQTAANEATDTVADATGEGSTKTRAAQIRGKLTAGVGITGLLATTCGVQALGESVTDLRYTNIVLPLVRLGMNTITMGAQVMTGQGFTMPEIQEALQGAYDPETDTSIFDARSIQAGLGQPQTGPDIPEAAKPGETQKPVFFQTVDSVIGSIPGGSGFCGAVNTTVGGWILTGFGVIVTATGPAGLIINGSTEFLQTLLVGTFIDDIVAWIAGDQVDLDLKGAALGGLMRYGSVLASNDNVIAKGGSRLTTAETRARENELIAVKKLKTQQESSYERYADVMNIDSFASQFLVSYVYPNGAGSNNLDFNSIPTKTYATLTRSFSSLFTRGSIAATGDTYDFGFGRYGFTQDEIDNPDYKDPYANEEKVEANLARLNDEYGEPCFNTRIDPTTYAIVTKPEVKRYDQIEAKCKDRSNEELTQYRFYLYDSMTAASLACYEGIVLEGRDFCSEVGLYGTGAAPDDNAYSFRAATFNVLGNQYTEKGGKLADWPSGTKRMNAAYEIIKTNKFDVIGFQELEEQQRAEFRKIAGTDWGIFPDPEKTSNFSSSNSIVWNNSTFDFVEGDYRTNLDYFDGSQLDAPWVKLRHKLSGDVIYYANTHDPATTDDKGNQVKYRIRNAKDHKTEATERFAAGEKVIMVGDYNSNLVVRPDYDGNIDREDLTYCIMTDGGKLSNAYDVVLRRTGVCPTKERVSIDNIYTSPNVVVADWNKIDGRIMERAKISDHDVVYVDIKIGSKVNE